MTILGTVKKGGLFWTSPKMGLDGKRNNLGSANNVLITGVVLIYSDLNS